MRPLKSRPHAASHPPRRSARLWRAGELPLLNRAAFSLESGERIGLIGRNGTGKSSLLGVIAGRTTLDDGELRKRDGVSIARVEQEPVLPDGPKLKEALMRRAAVPREHKLHGTSLACAETL